MQQEQLKDWQNKYEKLEGAGVCGKPGQSEKSTGSFVFNTQSTHSESMKIEKKRVKISLGQSGDQVWKVNCQWKKI